MSSTVCALSPNGQRFALVDDGRLRIMTVETGATVCVCVEPRHLSVAYSCCAWGGPGGDWVALGNDSGTVVVWDVKRAQVALVSLARVLSLTLARLRTSSRA